MLTSELSQLSPEVVRAHLRGLPGAPGYVVRVTPLRYHDRPHLSAWTDFDERSITLEIPDSFYPFGEVIPYGATRRPGSSAGAFEFIWLSEGVTFTEPRGVVRFLYLHEWMHWYLKERLGRKSHAETTCDRFALHNHLKALVDEKDARRALTRRPTEPNRRAGADSGHERRSRRRPSRDPMEHQQQLPLWA